MGETRGINEIQFFTAEQRFGFRTLYDLEAVILRICCMYRPDGTINFLNLHVPTNELVGYNVIRGYATGYGLNFKSKLGRSLKTISF